MFGAAGEAVPKGPEEPKLDVALATELAFDSVSVLTGEAGAIEVLDGVPTLVTVGNAPAVFDAAA